MKRIGLLLLVSALFIGSNVIRAEKPQATSEIKTKVEQPAVKAQNEDSAKEASIYQKLTADQIFELQRKKIEAESHTEMPFSASAIILICTLPFLFAGTIIVVNVRAKREESKRRYDLFHKSLEMGQAIPEHFFDEPKKENPISNLKKGIVWLVIGIGIVISFLVINEREGLIVGIIPGFVGIGYLLVHFLEKPKTESTAE
jgi:hypothetical protein